MIKVSEYQFRIFLSDKKVIIKGSISEAHRTCFVCVSSGKVIAEQYTYYNGDLEYTILESDSQNNISTLLFINDFLQ